MAVPCPCGCGRSVGRLKSRVAQQGVDIRIALPLVRRFVEMLSHDNRQPGSQFVRRGEDMEFLLIDAAHGNTSSGASLPSESCTNGLNAHPSSCTERGTTTKRSSRGTSASRRLNNSNFSA